MNKRWQGLLGTDSYLNLMTALYIAQEYIFSSEKISPISLTFQKYVVHFLAFMFHVLMNFCTVHAVQDYNRFCTVHCAGL